MIVAPTAIRGCHTIAPEPVRDHRGWFARAFDRAELASHGLDVHVEQSSYSFNERRGTLRGLHFQAAPHEEAKLVRCVRGAAFDVVVDLRSESPTFLSWISVELDDRSLVAVHVPPGCAHGFLTRAEGTLIEYQISTPYVAESSVGVNPFDDRIGVAWPEPALVVSDRDRALPAVGDLDLQRLVRAMAGPS